MDYKTGKLYEVVREFRKDGNRYEINGIELGKAIFLYREKSKTFEIIPKGNYNIVRDSNNIYINIDEVINSKAYEYQIIYQYSQISSEYTAEFPEIEILQAKYNEIVEDLKNVINYIKTVGIKADSINMSQILTKLEPNTTWVANAEGVIENIPFGDLNIKYDEMFRTLNEETKKEIEKKKEEHSEEIQKKGSEELKKYIEKLEIFSEKLRESIKEWEKSKLKATEEFTEEKKQEVINLIKNFENTLEISDLKNIEQNFKEIEKKIKTKEPIIEEKKSGFNLDKTDSYEEDDTNKLGTARALKRLYDEIVRRIGAIKLTWDSITGKPNISSSVTSTSESDLANSKAVKLANDNANGRVAKTGDNMTGDLIIKGHRAITLKEMAQSLGLEYGDDISEVGEKEVGKAYWHSASKKLYKCIRATTATSPAVDDFLPVDNNSLLDRLNNLFKTEILLNTKVTTGDFELSKDFNNYKMLIFMLTSDNDGHMSQNILFTEFIELNQDMELSTVYNLSWAGKFLTYKNFKTRYQNCAIHKVIGVKF